MSQGKFYVRGYMYLRQFYTIGGIIYPSKGQDNYKHGLLFISINHG